MSDDCNRALEALLLDGWAAASAPLYGGLGEWAEELSRRARERGLEIEMRVVRYQGDIEIREAVALGPILPTRREDYERLLEKGSLGKRSDGTLGDWPETLGAWAAADDREIQMTVHGKGDFCFRSALIRLSDRPSHPL